MNPKKASIIAIVKCLLNSNEMGVFQKLAGRIIDNVVFIEQWTIY